MKRIYQIFMGGFCDNLQDLISKLDYIKWMNFDSVLLSPIFESESYHGYDITDYYKINPKYGTMDDFKELIKEIENRDMTLILDFVFCHTSNNHQWFKDFLKGDNDYYISSKTLPKNKFPTPMNESSWWYYEDEDKYICSPWAKHMPSFNINSKGLRREIRSIIKYWGNMSKNIGWRLDAILYNNIGTNSNPLNYCKFIRNAIKNVNPNAFIVAEIWDKDNIVEPFANIFGSAFDFDMACDIKHCAYHNIPFYKFNKDNRIFFLNNHDQQRLINSMHDEERVRRALDILFTKCISKGICMYYGTEINMHGEVLDNGFDHTQVRKPMDWNKVKEDINNPNSLLNYIRNLNNK